MAVKQTEQMIQKAILDYLEHVCTQKIYFFRAGSGAMKTEHGRYFKTGKPGTPDIVLCLHCRTKTDNIIGIFLGIEVKTSTGRQSQPQKKAEKEIKAAGGEYYIVRSVTDVKNAINKTREKVYSMQ